MRRVLAAASLSVVVCAVVFATPVSAALTSWSAITSANSGALHNELHAVSATSTVGFAVGEYFNGNADRTLILKKGATGWSVVGSPNTGTRHNALLGVSVASATRAFAVGDYFNGKVDRTLILAWNGVTWKVQPSPNVGLFHNELDAVAAVSPTSVWAVGYEYTGKVDHTLIEHFNGVSWSVVASPNVGTSHNLLDGVAVVPGTRGAKVFAVGEYYNGVNTQNLVEHLVLGKWTVLKVLNVGTEANTLAGVVAPTGTSVYVVGTYTVGHTGSSVHTNQTLAEHWNGTRWTVLATDNQGTANNELLAVTAKTATSIYAVGRYFDGTFDQTMVQHWNGTAWHVSTSADVGSNHNALEGVATVPGGSPVTVGTYYSGTADRTLVESCKSCL